MLHLTVDGLLSAVSFLAQPGLAYFIFKRGFSRQYPILLAYMCFSVSFDASAWLLISSKIYPEYYFTTTVLDYLFQLLIILEIGRNVLRPSKRSLPFKLWPIVTGGILICAIVAAIYSPHIQSSAGYAMLHSLQRITLGLAILKLLLFAGMAGFAQFLGVGWKSLVLRLATGLAFYGGVSLLVQLSSSHILASSAVYNQHLLRLGQIQSAAYDLTLIFWIWAFSRNDAPRKDFTPQMQEVLVTIAGAAKRTRLAVTRSTDRR